MQCSSTGASPPSRGSRVVRANANGCSAPSGSASAGDSAEGAVARPAQKRSGAPVSLRIR
jgi:hypothetical protein